MTLSDIHPESRSHSPFLCRFAAGKGGRGSTPTATIASGAGGHDGASREQGGRQRMWHRMKLRARRRCTDFAHETGPFVRPSYTLLTINLKYVSFTIMGTFGQPRVKDATQHDPSPPLRLPQHLSALNPNRPTPPHLRPAPRSAEPTTAHHDRGAAHTERRGHHLRLADTVALRSASLTRQPRIPDLFGRELTPWRDRPAVAGSGTAPTRAPTPSRTRSWTPFRGSRRHRYRTACWPLPRSARTAQMMPPRRYRKRGCR